MKREYEKPELRWVSFQSQDMLMDTAFGGSGGGGLLPFSLNESEDSDKSSYQIGE